MQANNRSWFWKREKGKISLCFFANQDEGYPLTFNYGNQISLSLAYSYL